jgi:hypothetical protein
MTWKVKLSAGPHIEETFPSKHLTSLLNHLSSYSILSPCVKSFHSTDMSSYFYYVVVNLSTP